MSFQYSGKLLMILYMSIVLIVVGCISFNLELVTAESSEDEIIILFEDDFDGGLKNEWESIHVWKTPVVSDGKVIISEARQGIAVNLSDTNWTDYTVEVDLAVEGSVPVSGESSVYECPQIIFRADSNPAQGWGDFYIAIVKKNKVQLFKQEGGKVSYTGKEADLIEGVSLGSDPIRVKIEVKNTNIRISVDGYEYINFSDSESELRFGGAGVQSWTLPPNGAKWVFDNFRVYKEAQSMNPDDWSNNTGERLYNGIVLPEIWPPTHMGTYGFDPLPVPYLDAPPEVIPIDVGRQLFVDDFLIEDTTLERTYYTAQKYEGNPVLMPETELEHSNAPVAITLSGGVWWDPHDEIFKMWYNAGWYNVMAYATSEDGIHWERPDLDINPGTNQISFGQFKVDSSTVVLDHNAPIEERFKMFIRPPGRDLPGYSMVSADGIHWSEPVETGIVLDCSTMFYNPFRDKWVYSIKDNWDNTRRSRAYSEHDDFLEGASLENRVLWTRADRLDLPDPEVGDTPQLYNFDAVAYESLMIGAFNIHLGPPNEVCAAGGFPKLVEIKLGFSRDGFHWYRPDRRAFIPASRDEEAWDRGYVMSAGGLFTVMGDELWFYYTGFNGDTEKKYGGSSMYSNGSTGIAKLRRDGFASMDAVGESGTLTTRPVKFSGKYLFVNVDNPEGELLVEVLNENGEPFDGFALKDCKPVAVDSTLVQVTWDSSEDLTAFVDKPVRFRFHLTNGKLYSFWVSPDKSGASYGYVGAGGPGFTGAIDTVGKNL